MKRCVRVASVIHWRVGLQCVRANAVAEMPVTGVQLFCFEEQLIWSRADALSWSRA